MATQTDTRKNIKVSKETRDRLNDARGSETWDEFLNGLLDGAPVVSEDVELTDKQTRTLVRELGDEVEGRLR